MGWNEVGVVTYSEIYPIQIYYKLFLFSKKKKNKKEKGKTINHHQPTRISLGEQQINELRGID